MTTAPTNLSASVRARLLALARRHDLDFQLVLTRYANERLLYRLARSPHGPRFVLKGAALFTIWTGAPHRSTRDLDLLGDGDASVERLRTVFAEVLALPVEDDGMRFDLDTLAVAPIRADQRHGGVRVTVVARLTAARVRLQVDVGFGDAITPEAALVEFPPLLGFPAPRLLAYPRETVVAEKLEAMVQLGLANSRMKDFYDIAFLAQKFDFAGEPVVDAIRATFGRRRTAIPRGLPVALTPVFTDDATKRAQWDGFVRKAGVAGLGELAATVAAVTAFAQAPLAAAMGDDELPGRWPPGGPWDPR